MFYQSICEEALKYSDPSRGIHVFDSVSNDFQGESYLSFLAKSHLTGQLFHEAGLHAGQPCIIATQSSMYTVQAFLACLSIGAWPMIVPSAKPMKGQMLFRAMVTSWVEGFSGNCGVVFEDKLPYVTEDNAVKLNLDGFAELLTNPPSLETFRPPQVTSDVAYLQLTSATTSRSKLVAVTNGNILANLRGVKEGFGGTSDERWVTWLPLYHDMGLVGVALQSLRYCFPLYIMSPFDFLKRPARWFEAMSTYQATMTAAPNFGFDYASRVIKDDEVEGIRLKTLKGAFIGAEPVLFSTLANFHKRFARNGFPSRKFIPGYGLAESTVASTMGDIRQDPPYLVVSAEHLAPGGSVTLLGKGSVMEGRPVAEGMVVFSVGKAIDGVKIRILDADHCKITEELRLGIVSVKGSSVCPGYLKGDELGIDAFPDDVLITGDLGFIFEGELYIFERINNTIIRHGQNYFAFYFEEQVAKILGCAPQQVIVFDADIHNPYSDVVAVVEQYSPHDSLSDDAIMALGELDLTISKLFYSERRVIPRTTSGKKKYLLCRQQYQEHKLPIRLLSQEPQSLLA